MTEDIATGADLAGPWTSVPQAPAGRDSGPADIYPVPKWTNLMSGGAPQVDASPAPLELIPGIVDAEEARKLTAKDIIQQISRAKDESKKQRVALESEWAYYQNLYDSKQDWTDREEWQATVFYPLVFGKIESFKSMVKSALMGSPQWFGLDGTPQFENSGQQDFLEKTLSYQLREARFPQNFVQGIEEGSIFGAGCVCLWWDAWVERQPRMIDIPTGFDPMTGQPTMSSVLSADPYIRSGLKSRFVPIWSCYPDPYAANFDASNYFIEDMATDEWRLEEGLRAGLYDSLDDLGAPVPWDMENQYRYRYVGLPSYGPDFARKRHLLTIYHGNFYSAKGKLVLKNFRAIVGNNRALLAFGPNPNVRGTWPYVWITPIPQKGRIWGRSMIGPAGVMQTELNHLVSIAIDQQTIASIPTAMVDTAGVDSASDITTIEPGKVYYGKAGAVQPIQFAKSANDIWPVITKLEQGIAQAMQMNEFVEGAPTTKGRPTATEVQQKSTAGQSHINNIAADIEESNLVRAVQIAYELSLQYLDDLSDPELRKIVEEYAGPVSLLDEQARFKLLDAKFRVRARGISLSLQRQSQVEKFMQALQIMQQMQTPPKNQLKALYKVLEALNVDPQDFGFSQSVEAEIAAQMQMMQMMQQQGAGGGQGSGPSPAPPPNSNPPAPNSPQSMMNQMAAQVPPPPPA